MQPNERKLLQETGTHQYRVLFIFLWCKIRDELHNLIFFLKKASWSRNLLVTCPLLVRPFPRTGIMVHGSLSTICIVHFQSSLGESMPLHS